MKQKSALGVFRLYMPKSWLFWIWQASMLAFLFIQFLRTFDINNKRLDMLLVFLAVVGGIDFFVWVISLMVRSFIKETKKDAFKDFKVSFLSSFVFFIGLFFIGQFFSVASKSQIQRPDVQLSEELTASEYRFNGAYPENSLRMHDLSLIGDPRRFHLYLFDDKLKMVSFDSRTELRIEANDVVVFKMYGNNIYRSELLKVATSSSEYTQKEVYYKGSTFEKEAKVFHKQSGDKYIYHYLFKYGDLDYLITAEWKVNKDYSDIANKLIATLAPTTMSAESVNKVIQGISCRGGSCENSVKGPTLSPTEKPLHVVYCFVDREGKFDIFYTECQAMHDKDKEVFKRRAIDICLEGRSPALKEQGTRSQREKLCPKIFSEDPMPIAHIPD